MAVTYYPRSKAVKQVEILFGSKTLPLHFGSAVFRLPLMIRTEVPALPGFGSAGLAFEECVRAGRACDVSQARLLKEGVSGICR